MSNKITVLFLAANAVRDAPLDLAQEARMIQERIEAAKYRDSLSLQTEWAVRRHDLQQALLKHKPHIVHFSAHGSRTNEIILRSEDGEPDRVGTDYLRKLFKTLRDNVRLVVFNACYSREQALAVTENVDCAVGMSDSVPDDAAIDFSASFYRAIGFGRSVQTAFELGALDLEAAAGAQLAELHVREGVEAGHVVLVEPDVDDPDALESAKRQPGPRHAGQEESPALKLWREKLAFLQGKLALETDAAVEFKLKHQIEEAKNKIVELEGPQ